NSSSCGYNQTVTSMICRPGSAGDLSVNGNLGGGAKMRKTVLVVWMVGLVAVGCKSEPQKKPDQKKEKAAQKGKQDQPDAGDDQGDTVTQRMGEEHEGDEPTPTGAVEMEPAQPVTTKTVDYATLDGTTVTGYYAEPKQYEGDLPGIILIHEWWGLNDNIRAMTRRLAGQGYRALAVDLYEGEIVEDPGRAQKLMKEAMAKKVRIKRNLRQAYEYLHQEVGAPRIGVIGWCFGGGWSLQTALMLPDKIDATVIYYGQLVLDKTKLKELNMPVLGFFGAKDSAIPPDQARKFEEALKELDKKVEIHIYKEAGHAFANPSGQRYVPEAANDAWKKTLKFFDTYLTPKDGGEPSPDAGARQPDAAAPPAQPDAGTPRPDAEAEPTEPDAGAPRPDAEARPTEPDAGMEDPDAADRQAESDVGTENPDAATR
ncbi:MAG: dienelactone hydrolase family protein, partial [Bradymonadaceae bacterium]